VHHDLWDYDTPSEPLLFTFRGSVPAVAVTTKTDMVYVFNRLTGDPLYPIVERTVASSTIPGEQAWPTQPFSTLSPLGPLSYTANDVHLHDTTDQAFCREWLSRLDNHGLFTPPSTKWTLESPGNVGGSNWGSSAFDPTTSIMYTRVSMLPFIVRLLPQLPPDPTLLQKVERHARKYLPEWAGGNPPSLQAPFSAPDHGATLGGEDPQAGAPFRVVRQPLMTPDGTPCGPPPFGSIVAFDLNTGQKLLTIPHGEMVKEELGSFGRGGLIATGGGLLFAASTADAYLRAYDSKTGRELWRGKLPASANATPMTYMWRGRQYVVIAAGGDQMVNKRQSDTLIAFALPQSRLAP
jgi:quinoprotein glucose dehydrogenase